jgi:two-component system, LytTR family, sensor kinase
MPKLTIPTHKIITAYAGWWIVWMGVQAYLLNRLGYPWSMAVSDATVTQLVLAVAGYAINTSMHYYNPSQKNSVYVLSWAIALAALSVFLQHSILGQLFAGTMGYVSFLDQSLMIRGLFDWFMITLIAILTWSWVYVRDQQDNEKRKEDAERFAREAELSNLRQQLQPHFLFNSLNSISALVNSEPEQARKMIQQLSDFLRGTVKKDDRQFVSLEEELQHLQLYLDIEKVRFGHRLATAIDADELSVNLKLPSLLLQPIVENAIKFGLYDTLGEITISIVAKTENGQLLIEIKNPFDPATAHPRQGTGFGLNSIRRRLYLLYAQNDLLLTKQDGTVFITSLKIPQYS